MAEQDRDFVAKKSKHPKWQKRLGAVLFVLLNIAVIAVTAINEFGNSRNAAKLSEVKINLWLILPAIILFIVATALNIYKYIVMMRASYDKDKMPSLGQMWRIAWRVVMLGKYYDNITPASIGGQPFQIYYMRKSSRLPRGHATALPLVGMVAGQTGFLIIAIFCFVLNSILGGSIVLMVTAWIGLIFYAFWPILIFGISFFPEPTRKLLGFGIKVLSKIKIIKNRDAALVKIEEELKEYVDSIKMLAHSRGVTTKVLLLSVLYNILTYLIPYFVLRAFGGDIGVFECFATTLAVTSAVYFVPTPGNSGAAEGTFYAVFAALSTGYIFWAMLIWRFFSYYIYILLGLLTYAMMRVENKHSAEKEIEIDAAKE